MIAPTGHIVTLDGFFDGAKALRKELDARLADERDPFDPSRFAWECWHIDGQFSQARTPARSFFGPALIAAFERRLLSWASLALGLSALGGPPWLSSVTDGGFQALHRDSPNGHFAFSYGLAKGSGFRGGETQIASFDLLDYFRRGAHTSAQASSPLFEEVPSRYDRLVAFDARLPHAVKMVTGPRHLRDGRVAIQGWLTANGCVARKGVDGALANRVANRALARCKSSARGASGLLAVRVQGNKARVVCDTLVDTGSLPVRDGLARQLVRALAAGGMPTGSDVVVPVIVGSARGPLVGTPT